MKVNSRRAKLNEKEEILSIIHFLKKKFSIHEGVYYDDPLLNKDGIHLILYPSVNKDAVEIMRIIDHFKKARDVVKTTVIFIPEEWINESH